MWDKSDDDFGPVWARTCSQGFSLEVDISSTSDEHLIVIDGGPYVEVESMRAFLAAYDAWIAAGNVTPR